MLQQTRVDTVIPYYERFLERFPSLQALADADESDVLKQWSGLGYYSRARNLKRSAECVVREHDGRLPEDVDRLRKLPGIGPYTAGAVASIAFRQPAPIVDGNVARVLARLCAEPALTPAQQWDLAGRLVPKGRPDIFNQALMELGALVCTPRTPRCGDCPVEALCSGRRSGQPDAYPAPKKRQRPRPIRAYAAVVERGVRPMRLLVVRRPSKGLLGGLWELPSFEATETLSLEQAVYERVGLRVERGHEIGAVRHVFSHRDLTLVLVRCHLSDSPSAARRVSSSKDSMLRWCSTKELDELPLSRLMQKVRREIDLSRRRLL